VYLALYGPQGLVIFDHPHNDAESKIGARLGAAAPGGAYAEPGFLAVVWLCW
jgi:hypothetical protein